MKENRNVLMYEVYFTHISSWGLYLDSMFPDEANKYFSIKKLKIKYKSSAHKFQAYIKTFCTRGTRK